MVRFCVTAGAILAGISVGLGAFGAHGLRETVSAERLDVWATATHYQLAHALALLILAALPLRSRSAAAWLFLLGTLVFSGSLYLLVLTDRGFFGAITPIGGVLFIIGWAALAMEGLRTRFGEQEVSR